MTADPGARVRRHKDGTVVVTLDNPAQRNALAMGIRTALTNCLRDAMADPACKAVVITGTGGHFCADGAITVMAEVTPLAMRTRLAALHDLLRLVLRGEKPVIAAVDGHAAGAGLALAAAWDIVVAAEGASFTCSFNRPGLVVRALGKRAAQPRFAARVASWNCSGVMSAMEPLPLGQQRIRRDADWRSTSSAGCSPTRMACRSGMPNGSATATQPGPTTCTWAGAWSSGQVTTRQPSMRRTVGRDAGQQEPKRSGSWMPRRER